ncbi:MAG: TauD/TfdA family dioxygenase [Burkholderiaceae bacterium]
MSDKELFEEYIYLSEIVKPVLSENLVNVLSNFKSSDNVALLIKGLPIDDLIVSTPKTGYFPNWATPIAVRAQFSIYGLLNLLPVVYSGENRTKLVRQVVPVASDVANASSHGSETTFGYHVDNPDLPLLSEHSSVTSSCPEYLSLYGVRGDSNVPTIIVSLIDVLNCLTLDDLGILQGPFFSIKRPASFDSNQAVTTDLPLLRFDDANGWLCRLDVENVSTDMTFAQEALDRFINLLNTQNFDQDFILGKGDFLIFKNQKVLHTRRRFTPRFDGQDRWLMRMFGLNSSERFIPVSTDLPYVCQV